MELIINSFGISPNHGNKGFVDVITKTSNTLFF